MYRVRRSNRRRRRRRRRRPLGPNQSMIGGSADTSTRTPAAATDQDADQSTRHWIDLETASNTVGGRLLLAAVSTHADTPVTYNTHRGDIRYAESLNSSMKT